MGILNALKGKAEQWLFGIALKKGVKAAVVFIASLAASAKVAPVLQQYGVTLDPNQLQIGLTAAGTAGLTMLLNWIKTKYGAKWL